MKGYYRIITIARFLPSNTCRLCRIENPGTNTTIGRNQQRKGEFRKVGENLYRYSSSGKYYAVFRVKRKRIWKSLGTADRERAKKSQGRARQTGKGRS